MTYPEVVQYLESFINYEKIPTWSYKESLKLERIKGFLAILDNPQDSLRCIHIAGTKGKGSTCAFISYILRETGYKVGLYTSPHLSDFRERIRILNPASPTPAPKVEEDFEGMISEDELANLIERLKPSVENYNKNSKYGPLSFFEVYTSLAFAYFRDKIVDFVVLETGLGGRLDATNVVNPLVCGISSLSYEHTQNLGNTLKDIATEKAGIIKGKQSIVITASQEKEAIEAIRNRAKAVGARLFELGRDIFYESSRKGFNVLGMFAEYPNLEIRLLGGHQFINATVAIGVIEALRFHNIYVGIDPIRMGLYNTIWPGRCEIISQNPLIVLDGAQNIASSLALKETIQKNFSAKGGSADFCGGSYKKLILVLGISNDKDIKGICNELNELADEVILTQSNNPRATEPKVLAKHFKDKNSHITENISEALELAIKKASPQDLILVTGSLFVVGEAREFCLERSKQATHQYSIT